MFYPLSFTLPTGEVRKWSVFVRTREQAEMRGRQIADRSGRFGWQFNGIMEAEYESA